MLQPSPTTNFKGRERNTRGARAQMRELLRMQLTFIITTSPDNLTAL